jgi:hypothetical protein
MAKTISELPRKHGGTGRKEAYPYDQWLDGQIWQLEAGSDYQAKSNSMMTNIRQAAVKRGLKVRTRFVDGGIVVQAFTPEVAKVEPEAPARPKRRRS